MYRRLVVPVLVILALFISLWNVVGLAYGAPSLANLLVDNEIRFTDPGFNTAHDINVVDQAGALRFYACPTLTNPPNCAAIQFFGNFANAFGGQVFIDSGAETNAAIIFRTALAGQPIAERMRITGNGNVLIGTNGGPTSLQVAGPGVFGSHPCCGTGVSGSGSIGVSGYSPSGTGVSGNTGDGTGVSGFSVAGNGIGVSGESDIGIGIHGVSPRGTGVHGTSTSGFAGIFDGVVKFNGQVQNSTGACQFNCPSDAQMKQDIVPLNPTLASLLALQSVEFSWRANEFPERHFSTERTIGLIAQDVETVLPELVTEDANGLKGVRYDQLPLLLLQGLKEVTAEKQALQERVLTLEEQNASLEARLATIEQRLNGGTVPLMAAR